MAQLVIFIVVSAGIVYLSWPSLRDPRSYGFARFFTFESILALVLLNAGHWFRAPLSPRQIVSWVLLLSSLLLAIHGFYLLRQIGKPKQGFESTTNLVMLGAYRYIRHPLYSSLLLFAAGAFLKSPSLLAGILLVVAIASSIATAKVEEAENLDKFGAEYAEYMQRTRMFVPFLF